MNIGVRLHDVKGEGLENRLSTARAQGFTCVHLALHKVLGKTYMEPENLTEAFGKKVRSALDANDMRLAVLGCYLNLAHPDPAALKAIQEKYFAHLSLLQSLGEGVLGTETGAPNAQYAFEPASHGEKALTAFIEGLAPVVRRAEALGLIVAIEPVYKHIVFDARRARKVLDALRSPALKIILDPVNLLNADNAGRHQAIIREAAELLSGDIAALHVKDFILEGGALKSVAAGEGLADWRALLPGLVRIAPGCPITLENTTPENAARARQYVEHCLT